MNALTCGLCGLDYTDTEEACLYEDKHEPYTCDYCHRPVGEHELEESGFCVDCHQPEERISYLGDWHFNQRHTL